MIINGESEKEIEDQIMKCLYTFAEGSDDYEKDKLKYGDNKSITQRLDEERTELLKKAKSKHEEKKDKENPKRK